MVVEIFGEITGKHPFSFEKLVEKLKESKDASINEYLFVAILYNILESGFLLCNDKFCGFDSYGYNAKAFKIIEEMPLSDIYKRTIDNKIVSFNTKMRIGLIGYPEVTLIAEPSVNSQSQFLIVSMLVKHPSTLLSQCFKTSDFIQLKAGAYVFKDNCKLSLVVKNELAVPLKQTLLLYQFPGCVPHLQRLPDHIFKIITKNLPRTSNTNLTKAMKAKYT